MNKTVKKICALAIAAACAAIPAVGAMAAPEDLIETNRACSITIHKYDLTAAEEDGVDVSGFFADGEKDADAEEALKRYQVEGVEFTYARVGNIHTESVGGDVKILYDIPKELEGILGLTDVRGNHKHTSDEINDAMKDALTENTKTKNALEDYIQHISGKAAMPLTSENGITSATNLSTGLYLVVETKVPASVHTTVDPFFVSLPMTDAQGESWFYDVEVYPKNQTTPDPSLDKMVRQDDDAVLYDKPEYADTATGSEGDRMDFLFVSHLPQITSGATYLEQYTFVDKMDKGLTYGQDAAIYFYETEEDAKTNNTEHAMDVWEHGSEMFTESHDGSNSDYNQMTIQMTAAGLKEINPAKAGLYMVVAYTATVNSDATPVLGDMGNVNDVKLTWKRTSDDEVKTVEDKAKVYTYGLDIDKKFSGSKKGDATQVEFVLQNQTDGHYVTAKREAPGVYYVTDANKGATEKDGTVFSPATDGSLVINGLEADTYVLTEVDTADGFALLKDPILIAITGTEDQITPSQTTRYDSQDETNNPNKNVIEVEGERASAKVDGKDAAMLSQTVKNLESSNASVDMEIINTPSFTLPKTGGYGTLIFTLAGCMAALTGVIILTRKGKKEDV
ncbi:SpaH/EbpB family LPXTG-anchored major pilin [uncultured Merdimonas sp.]|uniref:SpaH/EbpB family LPXTG-anchored major pilin n=1 Tax=uncultured Merdimonas sp. TaxID=2023269 RepID=UPI00320A81B4